MKYVMLRVKNGLLERDVPIIFPDMLVHKHVADVMCEHLRRAHMVDSVRPVSAGEVNVDEVTCHGESTTLKLSSRGAEDDTVILNYDYLHGVVA